MEYPVTSTETGPDNAERIIESLQDAENSALEAVRKFLDTVNGVFPDFTAEGGPRQKIIDSAFKMTEQLVGTSEPHGSSTTSVAFGDRPERACDLVTLCSELGLP
jgi:hypothetical protein